MKQRNIGIFIVIVMLLLAAGCSTHASLEGAIQSKWKTPIKVVYVDENKRTVVFVDHDLYVFNTFEKRNDKYRYSTDGEDGYAFSAAEGMTPFLVRARNTKTAGNVIWGALKTDIKIATVEVTFTYRDSPDTQFQVTAPVVENVFIGYPEQNFFNSEVSLARKWKIEAKAFDAAHNEVAGLRS